MKTQVTSKKIINTILTVIITANVMLYSANCFAQGAAINTTGTSADASAILDVSSTSAGMLIPRMTSSERNSIVNPAKGLIIYNLDCDVIDYNAGNSIAPNWLPVTPSTNIPSIANNITGSNCVCQGSNSVIYQIPQIANAINPHCSKNPKKC